MIELINTITMGLIVLIPLANPITTVALFIGLSSTMTKQEKNKEALYASIYVFLIIVLSFYFGQFIMKSFGISIPGLRIAGGMIVSYIGLRMLFPTKKEDEQQNQKSESIAFVPLAMPSTAGPGTIAMVISAASTVSSGQSDTPTWIIYVTSIAVPLILSVILWLCLRSADSIMKIVGRNGVDAISRVMGFLLVCMGTQFVINGVKEIIINFPN
ncbi:MarC family NAAT transporter [Aliarcobacter lanthieri]|uniref:MarC family NAAT transporter n=1 Tax=Aliarcobacter lanthieri TaxID=1355374 RepID=UPI001922670C|nr:MarC family NAAT transporter [Aliarcobacter lanthieri]MBL3520138.1 MarC family NAAT transporter [Aliarcobacter lanthieri]